MFAPLPFLGLRHLYHFAHMKQTISNELDCRWRSHYNTTVKFDVEYNSTGGLP